MNKIALDRQGLRNLRATGCDQRLVGEASMRTEIVRRKLLLYKNLRLIKTRRPIPSGVRRKPGTSTFLNRFWGDSVSGPLAVSSLLHKTLEISPEDGDWRRCDHSRGLSRKTDQFAIWTVACRLLARSLPTQEAIETDRRKKCVGVMAVPLDQSKGSL